MTDREKVISSFEYDVNKAYSEGWDFVDLSTEDAKEILALLKEQEPVEPVEMIADFYPIGDPLRTIGWKCGKCMERIEGYDNYCPNCGQAVKWDD